MGMLAETINAVSGPARAISEALARADTKYAIADRFDDAKGEYVGLKLSRLVETDLNSDAVLVRRDVAEAHLTKEAPEKVKVEGGPAVQPPPPQPGHPRPRRFYAKVSLDPNRPTPQVSNIAQSILSELERARGTRLTLTLDIDAETADGFPEDVESVVRDAAFVNRIGDLTPQLVTFNGSSFDLPVLRYRAMVCGVAAPGLALRPYFNRYTEDAIDLCDVLASFSPQNKASLDELCRVMGLPGKPEGIAGADVEKYVREGRIAEVAAYCETDVVNTYRVWLRYELFRGRLTESGLKVSEANLSDYIRSHINTKPHLAYVQIDGQQEDLATGQIFIPENPDI
jgi:hypothetical protein